MKRLEIDPREFLEAGGRLSLAEYLELLPEERAAFAAAGRAILRDALAGIWGVIGEEEVDRMEAETLEQMAEDAARRLA